METSATDWKQLHSWCISCLKVESHVSSYWICTQTGYKTVGRRNSHIGVEFQRVLPKWTFYCTFQDKSLWSGLCRKHNLWYCVHRQWLWLKLKETIFWMFNVLVGWSITPFYLTVRAFLNQQLPSNWVGHGRSVLWPLANVVPRCVTCSVLCLSFHRGSCLHGTDALLHERHRNRRHLWLLQFAQHTWNISIHVWSYIIFVSALIREK